MKTTIVLAVAMAATAWGAAAQRVADSAWHPEVRTAELYREGAPLEQPTLTLGRNERLVLAFDMLETQARSLRWSIGHCNADWQRDDMSPLEYATGLAEGPIDDYDFSFNTLTDYVHYRQTLPPRYTELTHSGNYALTVTDEATGDTLLTRRFCVSEQQVRIDATISRPYDGVDMDRRQEVDVCIYNRDLMLRPEYVRVVVQQNGRLDNRRQLDFSGYDGASLCYRNRQANIFYGGNNYRFFDLSNLRAAMYNVVGVENYGGELNAMIQPCENRSRGQYITDKTLNGGMKVNISDRQNPATEADYVWVNLSLPAEQPSLEGSIYVVGALTDWRLDTSSRMEYSPSRRAYTARLLLKQGYYAYQLLLSGPRTLSATAGVEGDHHETHNDYTIYIYYHSPAERADRLIGTKKITR